ncbi:hypothetical protein D3C77_403000 [compost metagenome]
MALGDCHYHYTLSLRLPQGIKKVLVVSRAGAAAEAFQDQALDTAGKRCKQDWRTETGYQRQYCHADGLFGLSIIECFWQGLNVGCTAKALECDERVPAKTAHLSGTARLEQFAMKIQLHTRSQALSQCVQGADKILPGITVGNAGWQHGTGEQHWGLQTKKLETHGGSAVGEGVGAVQDQHGITALNIDGVDDRFTQSLPILGRHVGAVDQWLHFAKPPAWEIAHSGQVVAHPLLEARGRGEAAGTGLHADGATGIQHHDVTSGVYGCHGLSPWSAKVWSTTLRHQWGAVSVAVSAGGQARPAPIKTVVRLMGSEDPLHASPLKHRIDQRMRHLYMLAGTRNN